MEIDSLVHASELIHKHLVGFGSLAVSIVFFRLVRVVYFDNFLFDLLGTVLVSDFVAKIRYFFLVPLQGVEIEVAEN